MGTLNAFYVRIDTPEMSRLLLARCSDGYTEETMPFFAVHLSPEDFDVPTSRLVALSLELKTDVIWLHFQSAVDSFHFRRWKNGELVRALVYGCFQLERTWEVIEGAPEEWECAAIFDPDELGFLLDDSEDEEEKARLEKIWEGSILEVGSEMPMLDGREVARRVAEFYRLPGWGLSENEA